MSVPSAYREPFSFTLGPWTPSPPRSTWSSSRYLRDALVELSLLAVAGGLLGAWIVLRRLAFFSHAVGTATFPGLGGGARRVLQPPRRRARAWRWATRAASSARGGAGATRATPPRRSCWWPRWPLGVILASDVLESGAAVDRLLFGTVLAVGGADLAFAAVAAAGAVAVTWRSAAPGRRGGLRPRRRAPRSGCRPRAADLLLLALVAVAAVAALPAVGALLVTSLLRGAGRGRAAVGAQRAAAAGAVGRRWRRLQARRWALPLLVARRAARPGGGRARRGGVRGGGARHAGRPADERDRGGRRPGRRLRRRARSSAT